MIQSIITPLTRQLVTYRHQALAAPTMLDDGTLAPSPVAGVLAHEDFQGRNRLFPPHLTLWTFLLQVRSPDGSCREALSRLRPWMIAQGQTPCSPNTGSYCKARKRLPEGVVSTLARHSGQRLCEQTPEAWLWQGRRVKMVDGSTVSMPDTEANQAASPQPRSQQPGLGFPLARLVAVFDLGSGALTTLGVGRYHHRRTTDFRCGQRLGREDHRVEWCKPVKPAWMDQPTSAGLPDQLTVRELRVRVGRRGFRTQVFVVVTTLLDAMLYSAHDIADLYGQRWHCELDLRSIKVALGMDVLRCRTPEMVRKELWMDVLASNLIRAVMVRAALSQGLYPRQLSFKGALQAVNGFTPALVFAESAVVIALLDALLESVAAHRVGQRPNRVEPRAVKRRPKAHKLLSVPRLKARKRLESGRAA